MNATLPMMVLSNQQVTDKILAAAGYAAGLGQMDVRELSRTPIPVWAVALAAGAAGFAAGIWVARRLPAEWIVGKRDENR